MDVEKVTLIKTAFYVCICTIGGFVSPLLGGYDYLIHALVICSIIDYFSGGAVELFLKIALRQKLEEHKAMLDSKD